MLTTENLNEIKNIYRNLDLHHKEVLKRVGRVYGKKISYPTLLAFLEKEGEKTRKQQRLRMKKHCKKCNYEFELCICDGVAHG